MSSIVDVFHDEPRGLLSVEHNGSITWDELQAIKNQYLGEETAAIEVYPPKSMVVNSLMMRHLWKLGTGDWWPDLSGMKPYGDLGRKERDLLLYIETGSLGAKPDFGRPR